jgi:hypothetical protein
VVDEVDVQEGVFWKSCGSFWAVAPVNARFGAPA